MSLQIYINEQLIELPNDDTIGLNFQVYSIFNAEGRSGFVSSPIKAPKTRKNNIVFESLSNVNSATVLPYRKLTAKVVQNGIEIMPNGFAIIKETSDSYQFNVFSGNVNFFDLIKGLNVNEIDTTSMIHNYTVANVAASFSNTENYIYPIVDWGDGIELLDNSTIQNTDALLPCLFLKTFLEKSAHDQSYSLTGTFIDSDAYDRLLITPNQWGYTEDFVNSNNGYAGDSTPIAQTDVTIDSLLSASGTEDFTIPFVYTTFTKATFTGTSFTPAQDIYGTLRFYVKANFNCNPIGNLVNIDINIKEDGVVIANFNIARISNFAISFNQTISTGQMYISSSSVYSVDVEVSCQRDSSNDYLFRYTWHESSFSLSMSKDIPYGAEINPSFAYDWQQVDVWKDTMNMYCLVMQTNEVTKTIHLNYLNDITTNIKNARNWSDKIVKGGVKVSYDVGGYAQRNYIKYAEDEDVSAGKGDGYFDIDDENLIAEKDLFRLKAAAVEDGLRVYNNHTPTIPFQTYVGSSFDKKKTRFLLLDKTSFNLDLKNTVNSDVASVTNVPFCYFEKSGKNDNLDFQSLIDTNYSTLTAMFDKYKRVVCQAKLTELDVLDFDFTIPIYVEYNDGNTSFSGNYYVNKISNFKRNKTTTLELIRL